MSRWVQVAVFLLVCVLTLMVASPDSRYSKAGLYAILATQSNDFALGYPIGEANAPCRCCQWRKVLNISPSVCLSVSTPAVDALYRSTYPEYLQYIYLVAPVSLMLLNPIGFALCEVQRWKQTLQPQRSRLLILGVVVLQVHTGVFARGFFYFYFYFFELV